MNQKFFPASDPKASVPADEEKVLQYWKDNDIFKRSVEERSEQYSYRFFDGPPFATGLPHYGHIIAGAIKDVIPRYWTMKGYRVERRFGWDCHGLPVEFLVEKENNIAGKPEIEKMGVGKFNEMCRSVVMRCAEDWKSTVDRMGRFVDTENDYKTMDLEFMESVWWVFGQMWDKGYVYEGEKVVAYSPKLGSPLSNFEANLNYKDIDDPAVTARFKLEDGTYALAWTTTPWTLPSNVGLGFGKNHEYVLLEHEGDRYWIADEAAERYFGEEYGDNIVDRKKGVEFKGLTYEPLFDFFGKSEDINRFICVHDAGDYITTGEGTGIVHFAPAFGEEDARVCDEFELFGVNPINDQGYFEFSGAYATRKEIPALVNEDSAGAHELNGRYFRDDPEVNGSKEHNANDWVIEALKESRKLFKRDQIRHSYPHCWRTDCALMYRGIKTWFINVQKIKSRMLELNEDINWIPDHLKHGRFGKIVEGAPDWAISRNRYWGTPIPVWRCDQTGEVQVVKSAAELSELCGQEVTDLHKHFVDDYTWENPKTGGTMVRIPEVFDCWVESGSMPYASVHYPFEHGEATDFPAADFIAEGMDQTRCWFYVLHVLGCALFDKPIYKNVVTNGIVLAEDGQKMSKSKKNYPAPELIFDKYGADAMRFYMLQSPAVHGENLRFAESGVEEVLKTVILPLKSAYNFLSTYANIDDWKPSQLLLIRHGQAEHNLDKIYSGKVDNPHPLTDQGRSQIGALAKDLPRFDALYSSPFIRTKETAEVVKNTTNFTGETQLDDRLVEAGFGDLDQTPYIGKEKRFAHPTSENLTDILARTKSFWDEVSKKHRGETVVVVSHGDPIGAMRMAQANSDDSLQTFTNFTHVGEGSCTEVFMLPEPKTDLDRWILSELQTLVKEYREKFDAYDIEGGLRSIPPFIDKLNNWYLRRSRNRFWSEGMSDEKRSGYETLHYVLYTLAEVMAPVTPFFADKLYQDLGGQDSVHLQFFPFHQEAWIDRALEDKTNTMREIVSLAAGIRARAKVKLRQPLGKLRFALVKEVNLSAEDLKIVAQEANVKEVEILKSVDGIAKQIIKVDAKKVGRKFGKKTQQLIVEGKQGNFNMQDDGVCLLCDERLEADEYEVGFLTEEGVEAEATREIVVLLDTEITEDLKVEGYARELIRTIQETRKNNGFEISDRISVSYQTDSEVLKSAFTQFGDLIAGETLANEISEGGADQDFTVDGEYLKLTLTKQ